MHCKCVNKNEIVIALWITIAFEEIKILLHCKMNSKNETAIVIWIIYKWIKSRMLLWYEWYTSEENESNMFSSFLEK